MNPELYPKSGLSAFHLRQSANDGIDVPLSLPDGTSTLHSLRIRSADSDVFKKTEAAQRRRWVELTKTLNEDEQYELTQDTKLNCLASLIISWSFDEPCTPAKAKEFLRESPQIAEQIDRLAAKRNLFFKASLTNSTSSPKPNLS